MKNNDSSFYFRYSTWLGHATFAVLTVFAMLFFKERTLFLDAALQSFLILRDNDFAIQVHRFGAAMTQVFPLLASRMGGSLQTVLMAYSLGFVVVHWVMFWLCDHVLKQKEMAFCIVVFNVFMVNSTFYWAQNEVIQAISLGFVFWAWLLNRGSFAAFRWFDYPLFLGLIITLAFFHPLLIFPFSFVSFYFFVNNLKVDSKNSQRGPLSISLILTAFFCFITVYFLKIKLLPNYYDPSATERLFLDKNDLLKFIGNLKNAPSFVDLKAHLWTDFVLLPIVFMAVSIVYLFQKKYLQLLILSLITMGYILMILVSYREGGSWFHIESQYLPMSIFLIMPLVWEVIPALGNSKFQISDFKFHDWNLKFEIWNPERDPSVYGSKKGLILTTIVLSLMVLIRLTNIYQTHDFYTKRVDFIGELLEKTKKLEGTKFILEERLIDKTPLIQTWGFGYESLYYSALQSPDSVRSITILTEKDAISKALLSKNSFQGIFSPTLYSRLNPRLFHAVDTVHFYKLLAEKDVK